MVGTSTGDPRFFTRSGPHHLAAVAKAASGIAPELDLLLEAVAPLQTAGPNEVSFLDNPRYASTLEQTLAGAVIVHPDMQARVPASDGADRYQRAIRRLGAGCCIVPSHAAGFPRYPPGGNCRRGCARRSLDGSRTVVCD
jgi:UDP-3-O-[3-hydroxymyristoyl] glucosamine N-acyltransferase, LpxD